jgi:predicted ester cyclase
MGTTDLRAIYAAIIAAVGDGDDAALERLMAADLVDHNAIPGQPPGWAGFVFWAASARAAFSGLRGTIGDTVVEGDRLAARMTWHGTHAGPFLGMPATGRAVEFAAFHLVRFAGGRAAEWWGTADLYGALRRIGATVHAPG